MSGRAIIIICCGAIIGAVVIFTALARGGVASDPFSTFATQEFTWGKGTEKVAKKVGEEVAAGTSVDQYVHSVPRFSFTYPKTFKVGILQDDESGQTVLVQSESAEVGFQLHVSRYERNEPLTEQVVRSLIPSFEMKQVNAVSVAGAQGVMFESYGGAVLEVWFARNGYAFQVSAPKASHALVQSVLETIEWGE